MPRHCSTRRVPPAGTVGGTCTAGRRARGCARAIPSRAAHGSHSRPTRPHRDRQRHVLVEGAIGGGAAREEALARPEVLGAVVGVVVVDLVVVPGDDPGEGGVARLQVAVRAVERVAPAIAGKVRRLPRLVAAHMVAPPRGFVDVVAEEDNEVEVLGRHVAMGDEPALLVLLARGEGEAQPRRRHAMGRRRGRAADGRGASVGDEAVPVGAPRAQPADLDMHAVRPCRLGGRDAAARHALEAHVLRDFPGDLHRRGRHAARAIRGERLRREPRPDHEPVRRRIARRDAKREGIARGIDAARAAAERQQRRGKRGAGDRAAPMPQDLVHGVTPDGCARSIGAALPAITRRVWTSGGCLAHHRAPWRP